MESQEHTNDSSQEELVSKPTRGLETDAAQPNDKATIFESGDDAATAALTSVP